MDPAGGRAVLDCAGLAAHSTLREARLQAKPGGCVLRAPKHSASVCGIPFLTAHRRARNRKDPE